MFYIALINFLNLSISIIISYFWVIASEFYIEFSRSYAASAYPGDITDSQRYFYLFFFPLTLLVALIICSFILKFIFRKKVSFSLLKNIALFIVPVICTVVLFIKLYHYLF